VRALGLLEVGRGAREVRSVFPEAGCQHGSMGLSKFFRGRDWSSPKAPPAWAQLRWRAMNRIDPSARPWTALEIERELAQAERDELRELRYFHGRVARILAMTPADDRASGVRVYKIPPNEVLLEEVARLKALDQRPHAE
jgi:hypothetical protein